MVGCLAFLGRGPLIGPAVLGGVDVGVLGRVLVFGRAGGRVRLTRCMLLRRRRRADAVTLSCGALAFVRSDVLVC